MRFPHFIVPGARCSFAFASVSPTIVSLDCYYSFSKKQLKELQKVVEENKNEYFLPFQIYPWFKEAKISDIQNVCLHNEHHLNWPSLDIDLEIESIQSPDKYPMSYK